VLNLRFHDEFYLTFGIQVHHTYFPTFYLDRVHHEFGNYVMRSEGWIATVGHSSFTIAACLSLAFLDPQNYPMPCLSFWLSRNTRRVMIASVSAALLMNTGVAKSEDLKDLQNNTQTPGNGNHVVGPTYEIDPDLKDQGNPKGKLFEFSMRLADSKIYRGDDSTLDPSKEVRESRRIYVYIPAAYRDGTKAPILVTLDGPSHMDLVRNAVDNLTISKDPKRNLPAFITIAVENGGDDSYGSQRGLEYDTMSDRFARFINDEVLPAVLADPEIKKAYPGIAFTDDPWGKAIMGCSSGGAAALTAGWFRPDLFRRLITYSGTFVDQQDSDAAEETEYPLGAWEYHSGKQLIAMSEKKPLRIFSHVAQNDNRAQDAEETYHNWVMANERTAAALKAKGYDYRYVFSKESSHCDRRVFEHTLADTLVWMWQDYAGQ
jgi:iron(III)-enterobactin esterase